MDRFREPGEFSKTAGIDEETSGHGLQAMRGGSCYMAKGSQHSRNGGQLSASCGGRSNRQSSIRYLWPSHAMEGKEQLCRGVVRLEITLSLTTAKSQSF